MPPPDKATSLQSQPLSAGARGRAVGHEPNREGVCRCGALAEHIERQVASGKDSICPDWKADRRKDGASDKDIATAIDEATGRQPGGRYGPPAKK